MTRRSLFGLLPGFLSHFALHAQVPAQDVRNTNTPNTDTNFVMRSYASLSDWEARKRRLRLQILASAGLLPMPRKTPLHPQFSGRLERGDHTIENVRIETMPGYWLAGNLYRPSGRRGKFPGVLSPHGHWKHGRFENTATVSVPGRAISLARQGYVVFSYDMAGYNDTKQTNHVFGGKNEQLWSFGPLQLQLWNSIRALDFLQGLKDVDDSRIAVTGASGGGTQSFLLAAIDRRVKVAAPVNMVSGMMQGSCECENAPGLRLDTSNIEIAALIAPRPLLLVSATGDWTKNVPHVEFPAIQKIYALYRGAANVESVQINAGHNYNKDSREAVYRFFARHLLNDPEPARIVEQPFEVPDTEALRVSDGKKPPAGSLDYAGIFQHWKELLPPPHSARFSRFLLSTYLNVEWPDKVWSELHNGRVGLSRVGIEDRVMGQWIPGNSRLRTALVVHPEGAAAARKLPSVDRLVQSGRTVLLADVFQAGAAKAARNRSHKFFLTYNRTDNAARVQDILTALRFLNGQPGAGIDLIGIDTAGLWTLFAAAAAPLDLHLYADLSEFHGSDEEFQQSFFIPGIQRAGGLKTALRLAKPLPLESIVG